MFGSGYIPYSTSDNRINAVTTEVALLQAKEESRIVKEMRLMTLEMKNLQKDVDFIRSKFEEKAKGKSKIGDVAEQVDAGDLKSPDFGRVGSSPLHPYYNMKQWSKMNLGYARINMTLSDVPKSKRITTNRSMIKRTFQSKGLPYASEIALQNVKDLIKILEESKNDIKFYRMSSDIFPLMSEYKFSDLPDYDDIAYHLMWLESMLLQYSAETDLSSWAVQCIGSPNENVVDKAIKELNSHSEIFDLMGFINPSPYNKINIHVGGTYGGDFEGTAKNAGVKLFAGFSDSNCQKRLTLENDDKASMWSVKRDL